MKLRIISGILKGRFISIPEFGKQFRPTLERTRESVSEILKPYLQDAITADLCAGSGAFGFEMISRGAARVDFVENDRRRAELIRENAAKLDVTAACRIVVQDVRSFIKSSGADKRGGYDIIYFDPPYDIIELQGVISLLIVLLNDTGVLVYERRRDRSTTADNQESTDAKPFDSRVFGDTVVEFYRKSAKV